MLLSLALALTGCTPTTIKLVTDDSGGTADNGGGTGGDTGANGGDNGANGGTNGGDTGANGGDNGGDTGANGGDNGGDNGGTNGGGNGGDTGTPPPAACSRWLPLNVTGSSWVYDSSSGGKIEISAGEATTWHGYDVTPLYITGGTVQYYTCTEDGMAIVGMVSGKTYASGYSISWEPPVLFTPADLTENMSWSTESTLTIVQGSDRQTGTITAEGRSGRAQRVTVPAGTFDTISLQLDIGLGSTMTQYLTQDVGEVKGSIGELASYSVP